jgi:UDP-2,3-diacylglucosamine hydrolase
MLNTAPLMPKIYFISDLHLGATYFPDPRKWEMRVVEFLETVAADATELYLLGDILDYWYEYRNVAPRGFVRFFGALARMADRGVKIHWFIGNHDIWLFDYLRNEIGFEVVDGYVVREILGKRFFLSHGDGVGKLKPGFRFLRALFRNRVCQKLYAAVHPRWTIAFAHRWSTSSRDYSPENVPQFEGEDKEPLVQFSREYLRDVDSSIDYFVYGHRHILLDMRLVPNDSRIVILGDWIHHFSYGVYDGKDFELKLYRPSAK